MLLLMDGQAAQESAPRRPRVFRPEPGEFTAVSNSVITLLKTRDTARFATEMTATAEDWKAIASTNVPDVSENLKGFTENAGEQRDTLEAGAKEFLAKADSLHLDFSKGDLNFHARVESKRVGSSHYPTLQAEGETMPFANEVDVILAPDFGGNSISNGEFKIALRRLNKFPVGWRCAGGISWAAFPAGVADEKTTREMAIVEKAAQFKGITGEDDPVLLRLGQVLVESMQRGDTAFYASNALENSDEAWALIEKSGEKGSSREEFNKAMDEHTRKQTSIAQSLMDQNKAAGIDLKDAKIEIKKVSIERLQAPPKIGSADGLWGGQFKLSIEVETERRSSTGASLAGDYVLAAKQVKRFGDEWKVEEGIRWDQVPPGIFDAKAAAGMEVENYLAEHGTLPPGTAAPEIGFATLENQTAMKLSELRGKVVVLDFWATWCGPCQGPMADLQKLKENHANWAEQVAIVPLSIDDTLDVVRQHVNKRGWTNTFNVWAGEGGWSSAPAKAFRVSGVPTTYIIDARGKIVDAGHPAAMRLEEKVEEALALSAKGAKEPRRGSENASVGSKEP
jgi:thiol-disulfide isomerase/thioredoxin